MKLAAALLGAVLASADPIEQLASPKYAERELAMKQLKENLTLETILKLEKVLNSPSLEQSRRAEILIRPYLAEKHERISRETVQKMKDLCGGKLPWFNWKDRREYFNAAKGPNVAPDFTLYRNATELMLLDLARDRQPLEPVVQELKMLELQWIETYGKSYSPPLKSVWKD